MITIRENAVRIAVILLLTILVGCGSQETKIVARVGNDLITLKDFETNFYESKSSYSLKNVTQDDRLKFLDNMINQRLILQEAYRNKLDQEPKVKKAIEDLKKQIAYGAALDHEVLYKVIDENEIREFYDNSNVEVRLRQILLKLPDRVTQVQVDSVKDEAREILEHLQKGANFAEMVEQYSQDKNSRIREGDLGFVSWGKIEEELRVVFQLGRYEIYPEPIRTNKGVHIVQVTDRRNLPQKPFEVERENIMRELFRIHRSKIMDIYNDYMGNLKKTYQVELVDGNIDKVVHFFRESKNDSLYRVTTTQSEKDDSWIPAEIQDLVVAKYKTGLVDFIDFFDMVIKQIQPGTPSPFRVKSDFSKFLERQVQIDIIIGIGLQNDYLNESPYRERFISQRNAYFVKEMNTRQNLNLTITEPMLKEYYQNNPQEFKKEATATVQEIYVDSKMLAEQIVKQAKSGVPFDELAKRYNTRATTKDKNGLLGPITKNNYGSIGRNALDMKIDEIRGPIEIGGKYSVIKVLARTEEQQRPFEEVKRNVQNRLRQEMIQKSKIERDKKLREQIPVRVFPDVLSQALNNLT